PADRFLFMKPPVVKPQIVSRPRPIVPWLRRTEYIGADSKRFGIKDMQGPELK
ncbi:hypothetical protein BDK51DRAFT_46065, partial [Blyttiomyces helicus]